MVVRIRVSNNFTLQTEALQNVHSFRVVNGNLMDDIIPHNGGTYQSW